MPYTRNRRSRKFIQCVTAVTRKQGSETRPVNAFAVCRTSLKYKGRSKGIGLREYEEKHGVHIPKHEKCLMKRLLGLNRKYVLGKISRHEHDRLTNKYIMQTQSDHKKLKNYELITTKTGFDMPFQILAKNKKEALEHAKTRLLPDEKIMSLKKG